MNFIRKSPATFGLLAVNLVVFAIVYLQINSFDEPYWTFHLLEKGAEFNPFTLDRQWYRIFTHMFLHGGLLHLGLNMYGLYSVGTEIESEAGPGKFLWIYFISGVAAAFVSLYWSLFSIGVGASGAIFGLFGFSLVAGVVHARRMQESLLPVFLNFAIFIGLNLYFAKAFKADTAAHLGGLACGIVLGILSFTRDDFFWRRKLHYATIPLFIALYFVMPRYQVTYYKFFQSVLAAEDASQQVFSKPGSDSYYLEAFKKNAAQWDSTRALLDNHGYLPEALHNDTFKLRNYIALRKAELVFRIKMIEKESYVYVDSIELAQDSMKYFTKVDYALAMSRPPKDELQDDTLWSPALSQIKVLYNEDWEEVDEPPFAYYRIGTKDSSGRWQGALVDYYASGDVQMKGSYKNDERDGIFLYYSDHKTYTSAGRYDNDIPVGRWEVFHPNGKLHREEYYTDRYFMKSLWDSLGNILVQNGNGKVTTYHSNGVIAEEGEYRNGYKEGYWYGLHANGDMYYEENFYQGRLTQGRSRTKTGERFTYDESSFYPLPENGTENLRAYLRTAAQNTTVSKKGIVRLSFRVTEKGSLTDFKLFRSVSPETDSVAIVILKAGPGWIPAKEHGHKKTDGFASAEIEFR